MRSLVERCLNMNLPHFKRTHGEFADARSKSIKRTCLMVCGGRSELWGVQTNGACGTTLQALCRHSSCFFMIWHPEHCLQVAPVIWSCLQHGVRLHRIKWWGLTCTPRSNNHCHKASRLLSPRFYAITDTGESRFFTYKAWATIWVIQMLPL